MTKKRRVSRKAYYDISVTFKINLQKSYWDNESSREYRVYFVSKRMRARSVSSRKKQHH